MAKLRKTAKKKLRKTVSSKKKKKPVKKTASKKTVRKKLKPSVKKRVAKKRRMGSPAAVGCICIERNGFFFCMIKMANGNLKKCPTQPPFMTREECENARC